MHGEKKKEALEEVQTLKNMSINEQTTLNKMPLTTQGMSVNTPANAETTINPNETFPVTFEWLDKGNEVFITGDFFHFKKKIKLDKIEENLFRKTLVIFNINLI